VQRAVRRVDRRQLDVGVGRIEEVDSQVGQRDAAALPDGEAPEHPFLEIHGRSGEVDGQVRGLGDCEVDIGVLGSQEIVGPGVHRDARDVLALGVRQARLEQRPCVERGHVRHGVLRRDAERHEVAREIEARRLSGGGPDVEE